MDLTATLDKSIAYANADYIIIATPTNYEPNTNCFDTSSVESTISDIINIAPESTIVIKSTVPVGFTSKIQDCYNCDNIFYPQSFYVKAEHYTTTFIHHELLLVLKLQLRGHFLN